MSLLITQDGFDPPNLSMSDDDDDDDGGRDGELSQTGSFRAC